MSSIDTLVSRLDSNLNKQPGQRTMQTGSFDQPYANGNRSTDNVYQVISISSYVRATSGTRGSVYHAYLMLSKELRRRGCYLYSAYRNPHDTNAYSNPNMYAVKFKD